MVSTFQKRLNNNRKCPTAGYSTCQIAKGLSTLEYRRERADLIQVYKILNNIDIVDNDKLFTVIQRATSLGCLGWGVCVCAGVGGGGGH